MRACESTEITMFSGFVSRISLRSFGNSTGTVIRTTGTVIRKMLNSTSMTSTSGVVFIVEIACSSSSAEPTFIAMVALSEAWDRRSGRRRRLPRRQQHGVQIGTEAADAVHRSLVAADEPVVAKHRRYCNGKTDRRHDQRFADGTRDLVDRRLAGDT